MRTSSKLILAAAAVATLAVAGVGGRVMQQRPLVRQLAALAPPPPAPGVAPASPTSKPPAGSRRPLDEKQFVEISANILILAVPAQDRPNAKDVMVGVMAKVLEQAGVTLDDFEAYSRQVYADPARSNRVADATLERVDKLTTPQMRAKAADLVTAIKQAHAAKKAGPPPQAKP